VFAGLFGSQARREASSESDVDLLVRFEGRQSLIDLARVEREIGEVIGQSVDLVTENALSPYLRDRVMADLEVIVDDE
jgi:predicted nucleotidyltransferase